jgi:uncharacterized protein (UPF0147 family)
MCSEEHPDASRIVPPEGFPIHTTPDPKTLCRALQLRIRRPFATCSASSEEPLLRCSSGPEDPSPRATPAPKNLRRVATPGPKTLRYMQLRFRRTFAAGATPGPKTLRRWCNAGSEDPLSRASPVPKNLRRVATPSPKALCRGATPGPRALRCKRKFRSEDLPLRAPLQVRELFGAQSRPIALNSYHAT